jgi:hypothetical protein
LLVIAGLVPERKEHATAEKILLNPVESAAQEGTELVQCRAEVACPVELGVQPRILESSHA